MISLGVSFSMLSTSLCLLRVVALAPPPLSPRPFKPEKSKKKPTKKLKFN